MSFLLDKNQIQYTQYENQLITITAFFLVIGSMQNYHRFSTALNFLNNLKST